MAGSSLGEARGGPVVVAGGVGMALPGDQDSLIRRALTQLATLFAWRTTHIAGGEHDGRYYTETEVDSWRTTHLSGGGHDDRYYTESEVDALISAIPLTSPGGSDRQVQFNDNGSFGGSSSLTFSSGGLLTASGGITASGGVLATGDVGPQITIRDSDSSDASGFLSFEDSASTRLGYIGFGNNDDIHIKNENTGGYIYFATENSWRAYFNTGGDFVPYTSNTYDLGTSSSFWGNAFVAGNLYFAANDYFTYADSSNTLSFVADGTTRHQFYDGRIKVINTGWTTLGADSTWGRLETDRDKFYINREIWVDEGKISSYNENLKLQRAGTDRIVCSTSQIIIKDDLDCEHGVFINYDSPTLYLQDTNHRSAMLHCNSNQVYILRGSGNNSTSWTATNGQWPLVVSLNTNDVTVGGQLYVPVMSATWSYNTVRYGTGGRLYKYSSLAEMKTDITEINPLLNYLDERSLLYDLRPVIFKESEDRVDDFGEPLYTTRGEYAPGFIAEEVHEVAPELTYFDDDGELISYSNDALIPHIVAELQRLAPMVERSYAATDPNYLPPSPRRADRGVEEKRIYDEAAEYLKANPIEYPNPQPSEEVVRDDG